MERGERERRGAVIESGGRGQDEWSGGRSAVGVERLRSGVGLMVRESVRGGGRE